MKLADAYAALDRLQTRVGPRLKTCSVTMLLPEADFTELTEEPGWHKKIITQLGPIEAVRLTATDIHVVIKPEPNLMRPEWDIQPRKHDAHV